MSDDHVKAEARAVSTLRGAVLRYSDHLRDISQNARADVAAIVAKASDEATRRQGAVQRCEQDLARADRLSRQRPELAHAAVAARRALDEARGSLDRARKAAQLVSAAQSELAKSLNHVDSTVAEHSSVAASTLASLDEKLASLNGAAAERRHGHPSVVNRAKHGLAGVAIGIVQTTTGAATIGHNLHPAANGAGGQRPLGESSKVEEPADYGDGGNELVVEGQLERATEKLHYEVRLPMDEATFEVMRRSKDEDA